MKFRIITWGCIYWIVLAFCLMYPLQVHFASADWYINFNWIKFIIATAAAFIMLCLAAENEGLIGLFLLIILYLVVLPIGIIYAFQNKETVYYLSIAVCFSLIASVLKRVSAIDMSVSIHGGNSKIVILLFSGILLMLSMLLVYRQRGLPTLGALRLMNVYEIRSAYALPSMISALAAVTTKAVIPFLLAYSFIKKYYKAVILLLLVQFVFFLWLAHKTTIFSIGVFIVGYLLAKMKNNSLILSRGICLGVLAVSVLEELNGILPSSASRIIQLTFSLLVRRTILVPASLKYSYYDFFVAKGNPTIGLFGTVVAPILTRIGVKLPYDGVAFTQVVGNIYANGSNANTGVFGEELAHFGYFGIVIAGLLLFVFLVCVKKSETVNGAVFTCCLSLFIVIEQANAGAINLIAFSPMLFIAVILLFFKMNDTEAEKMANRVKTIRLPKRRIRFRP